MLAIAQRSDGDHEMRGIAVLASAQIAAAVRDEQEIAREPDADDLPVPVGCVHLETRLSAGRRRRDVAVAQQARATGPCRRDGETGPTPCEQHGNRCDPGPHGSRAYVRPALGDIRHTPIDIPYGGIRLSPSS